MKADPLHQTAERMWLFSAREMVRSAYYGIAIGVIGGGCLGWVAACVFYRIANHG